MLPGKRIISHQSGYRGSCWEEWGCTPAEVAVLAEGQKKTDRVWVWKMMLEYVISVDEMMGFSGMLVLGR